MDNSLNNILNALLEEKKSVFLTGGAGTGKTYNTNLLIEELEKRSYVVGRTATTALASQLVNGVTLHSYIGLPVIHQLTRYDYPHKTRLDNYIDISKIHDIVNTDFIVIDEVSMLNDMLFDMLHWILKRLSLKYAQYQNTIRSQCSTPLEFIRWIGDRLSDMPGITMADRSPMNHVFNLVEYVLKGGTGISERDLSTRSGSSKRPEFKWMKSLPEDLTEVLESSEKKSMKIPKKIQSMLTQILTLQEFNMRRSRALKRDRIDYELFLVAVLDVMRSFGVESLKKKWSEYLDIAERTFTGYIRLILIGDLHQLPPIVGEKEAGLLNYLIYSPQFTSENIHTELLTVNMRQSDTEFARILDEIRRGDVTNESRSFLESMRISPNAIADDYIELMNSNRDVDQKNDQEMEKIDGTPQSYLSRDSVYIELNDSQLRDSTLNHRLYLKGSNVFRKRDDGEDVEYNIVRRLLPQLWKTDDNQPLDECWTLEGRYRIVATHIRDIPKSIDNAFAANRRLELKIGAKVLVTKNIVHDGERICNGAQGTVIDMSDNSVTVQLLDSSKLVKIQPERFVIAEDHFVYVRSQIPLRAAYAITIHKSQGMTLDQGVVRLDKRNLWHKSDGMAYVALSRFRDPKRVKIRGSIYYDGIVSNKVVRKFYDKKSITREVNHYNKLKYGLLGLPAPIRQNVKGKTQIVEG